MGQGEKIARIAAVAGLVASFLSIFAFFTGIGNLPTAFKRPEKPAVATPAALTSDAPKKKTGIGGLWGRVTRPLRHEDDPKPKPNPAPAIETNATP